MVPAIGTLLTLFVPPVKPVSADQACFCASVNALPPALMRSGLLVAAFGVRVPQKLCWQHPEHPWNGNYLAVSLYHGATWSHVARLTSGVLTTHYMAVEETPTDNRLYVTYDLGGWSKGMRRDVFGRGVEVLANRK